MGSLKERTTLLLYSRGLMFTLISLSQTHFYWVSHRPCTVWAEIAHELHRLLLRCIYSRSIFYPFITISIMIHLQKLHICPPVVNNLHFILIYTSLRNPSSIIFYYDLFRESFQTSYCRHHAQLQFFITRNSALLFSTPSLAVTDDGA